MISGTINEISQWFDLSSCSVCCIVCRVRLTNIELNFHVSMDFKNLMTIFTSETPTLKHERIQFEIRKCKRDTLITRQMEQVTERDERSNLENSEKSLSHIVCRSANQKMTPQLIIQYLFCFFVFTFETICLPILAVMYFFYIYLYN